MSGRKITMFPGKDERGGGVMGLLCCNDYSRISFNFLFNVQSCFFNTACFLVTEEEYNCNTYLKQSTAQYSTLCVTPTMKPYLDYNVLTSYQQHGAGARMDSPSTKAYSSMYGSHNFWRSEKLLCLSFFK
jgi:hypothetical protein